MPSAACAPACHPPPPVQAAAAKAAAAESKSGPVVRSPTAPTRRCSPQGSSDGHKGHRTAAALSLASTFSAAVIGSYFGRSPCSLQQQRQGASQFSPQLLSTDLLHAEQLRPVHGQHTPALGRRQALDHCLRVRAGEVRHRQPTRRPGGAGRRVGGPDTVEGGPPSVVGPPGEQVADVDGQRAGRAGHRPPLPAGLLDLQPAGCAAGWLGLARKDRQAIVCTERTAATKNSAQHPKETFDACRGSGTACQREHTAGTNHTVARLWPGGRWGGSQSV